VAVRLQAGVTKARSAKNGNNSLKVFFITISSFLFKCKTDHREEGYSSFGFLGKKDKRK
jgi:hypothetical protein